MITAALKRARLSARAAARQAGISDARWRQITSGYQTVSKTQVPVRAPADTLARMARAVNVTPEDLEEAGRGDAAEELRALEDVPPPMGDRDDPRLRALDAIWETLTPPEQDRELLNFQRRREHPAASSEDDRPCPDPESPTEQAVWVMDLPETRRRQIIADHRAMEEQRQQRRLA